MPFGDWLKRELGKRDWSQGELARRMKSDSGLVSMWANNQRTPSRSSCRRIAEALGLPEQVVLEAAGRKAFVAGDSGLDLSDPLLDFFAHNMDKLSVEDREKLMRYAADLISQREVN